MSSADVAVVTVAYNAAAFIGSMLEALPIDGLAGVVVVDNASEPGLAEVVAAHRGVELVVPGRNLGFGAGNNAGVDRAPPSKWLLFLNPDAVLAPPELDRLVAYADAHPKAAMVGPRGFEDDRPLPSAGTVATARSELRHIGPPLVRLAGTERRFAADYARSGPVGYVEGCCLLVERAAFEEVRRFDERFFLCFEECDLARRFEAIGREVHLCAEARVQHRPATTRKQQAASGQIEVVRSAVQYVDKWHGAFTARLFRLAVKARILIQKFGGRLTPSETTALLDAADGRPHHD